MAAITYRETKNFTAAELETLRGLGFGPVPGAAEAGHGAFQSGHFRLGRGQAYRPGAGAGRRGDGGLSPLPAGGPGLSGPAHRPGTDGAHFGEVQAHASRQNHALRPQNHPVL